MFVVILNNSPRNLDVAGSLIAGDAGLGEVNIFLFLNRELCT